MNYRKSKLQLAKSESISSIEKGLPGIQPSLSLELLKSMETMIKGKIVFRWSPEYEKDKRDFNNVFPADPLAIIYVANYEDIRFVLKLAEEQKIAFCIRSGGHSLASYSVCDGLIIDMSQLHSIYVDPNGLTAYVEAGCTFGQIFPVIEQYGLHMVSGGCPTVSVSGYMQGGGYGLTSRAYGMGCDMVLSVTVMLASGKIVMSSPYNNQDLYWAIRGGTGGNFGILLNISYRLVPLGIIYGIRIAWDFENTRTNAAQALAYIQDHYLVAGAYPNLGIETVLTTDTDGHKKVFFCATWIGDETSFNAALAPLLAIPGSVIKFRTKGKYFEVNLKVLDGIPDVPEDIMAFSRSAIIAKRLSQNDYADILNYFMTCPNKYTTVDMEGYGGKINQIPLSTNAFIHRNAYMDFFCDAFFNKETNDRQKNEAWLESFFVFLRQYSNGHSYQNYPNRNQTDFRAAYWGTYYDQLLAIKQKYDPNNTFNYQQSIGPYLQDTSTQKANFPMIQNPIVYENY